VAVSRVGSGELYLYVHWRAGGPSLRKLQGWDSETAGGPSLELHELLRLWVPRYSRTLRRAGIPTADSDRFGRRVVQNEQMMKCCGAMQSGRRGKPIVSAASFPPLHKTQGRGTHGFRTGKKKQGVEGWATRPDEAYAPYGEVYDFITGAGPSQMFTGDLTQLDAEVLFDTPNREFASSNQGRWLSPDPAGTGWNQYAYATNPMSNVDPSGLACWPLEKILTGGCGAFMNNGVDFGADWDEFQLVAIAPASGAIFDGPNGFAQKTPKKSLFLCRVGSFCAKSFLGYLGPLPERIILHGFRVQS